MKKTEQWYSPQYSYQRTLTNKTMATLHAICGNIDKPEISLSDGAFTNENTKSESEQREGHRCSPFAAEIPLTNPRIAT